MNKITIQLNLFLVGFCVFVCVACQPTSTTINLFTPTAVQSTSTPVPMTATPKVIASSAPTLTVDLLPTTHFIPTLTSEPTNTSTPFPTQTWTPLPTLSPDEAMIEVQQLYETNNDCLLPCWWGITPGITDWGDARHFLASMSVRITERPSQNPDYTGYVFAQVYLDTQSSSHHYVIYDNRVIEMEGYIEMTPLFDPTTILATYGPPTEARFIGGHTHALFLFYPQYGFVLNYETFYGTSIQVVNGFERSCFTSETITYLVVWSPAETFTLFDRLNQTSHFTSYETVPGLPLEEATGMSIETFYQTFQNAEPPMCLETPDNLWVGR